MPGNAHILVGCGGSGIKTLTRMNELLSEDYYWRRRINTDVYYVVVDTDQEELREFEQNVHRQLAGCPDKPYILPIALSQGVVTLQPLVHQYFLSPFEGGANEEGRKRLYDHWWNRGPRAPFTAPDVRPVTEGAGQCPPVSYFLTWKNLEKLGNEFDTLIREIQKRQGGFGTMDVLNFLCIAGLSGGTGRGSWSLIAFKLRQLFEQYGRPAAPRAFLYDSSVFEDIYKSYGDQRLSMRVNALTGWSELTCWIRNVVDGKSTPDEIYKYRLPNMKQPENEGSDVLNVDLELDVLSASPVDHAYLIAGGSDRAALDNHYQYYEMVGAGIYAALSKSSIDRAQINSNHPYLGLATAMFEVNASTLRRYFESQARVQSIKTLSASHDDVVDKYVAEFFNKAGLAIGVTEDDRSAFTPDIKGTFIQRFIAALNEKCKGRLTGLDQALEEDSVEEVTRRVRGILAKNEDLVRSAYDEVAEKTDTDPGQVAADLAQQLFDETKSVTDVRLFVEKVSNDLEQEVEAMPAEMPLRRAEDPRLLVEDFASRPIPFVTRHFNEGECKKLQELSARGIARVNYPVIREVLGEQYRAWGGRVRQLSRNASDLVTSLQKLEHKFVTERERASTDHGSAFDNQFSDFDRPEDALEERFSARKFYRRILKPVMKEGGDLDLLEKVIEIELDLYNVCRDALMSDAQWTEAEAYDQRKKLQRRLEEAIRETVGIGDDFIAKHFSIRGVIEQARLAWQQRLHKKMSQDDRGHLEEKFKEFFGFIPKRTSTGNEIEYQFPDEDDFILQMAASLARTCKPHWILRKGDEGKFRVVLFVPTSLDKEAAESRVKDIVGDESVQAEVYPEQMKPDDSGEMVSNPFILLAYSTQGIDRMADIASFDYWESESGVTELVEMCERTDGKSIFDSSNNNGIGYVDPMYVNETKLSSQRWKPWAKDVSLHEEHVNSTLDGLLYALFPGADAQGPLADVVAKVTERNWAMPLIHDKGKKRYAFTRLALHWDGDAAREDQQTPRGWEPGKPVAPNASLHHAYEVLLGSNPETARADWRQRIIAESTVFWRDVLLKVNCAQGSPAYDALLDAYIDWLGAQRLATDDDHPDKAVWEQLIQRATDMRSA